MLLALSPGSSQPPWHREGLGPQGVGTGAWVAGHVDRGQRGTHSCLFLLFLTTSRSWSRPWTPGCRDSWMALGASS